MPLPAATNLLGWLISDRSRRFEILVIDHHPHRDEAEAAFRQMRPRVEGEGHDALRFQPGDEEMRFGMAEAAKLDQCHQRGAIR